MTGQILAEAPIRAMLRQHRALHNLKQNDLARQVGITPSTLCRFENGRSLDSGATIRLIAWLFGQLPDQSTLPSNQA